MSINRKLKMNTVISNYMKCLIKIQMQTMKKLFLTKRTSMFGTKEKEGVPSVLV